MKTITAINGKTLELPSRMFRPADLESMGIPFVEQKILFNVIKADGSTSEVTQDMQEKMIVVNYPDCSRIPFSTKELKRVITEQLHPANKNDFIWMPYFKDESEYDLRQKFELASILKQEGVTKGIVIEMSYKARITSELIKNNKGNFDALAIFYGVYYGQPKAFFMIAEKILMFKTLLVQKIFCTCVPLMFAEDQKTRTAKFLPFWSLLCDGWIKNWCPAGGGGELRLVDKIDLRNKEYNGWLEAGHRTFEVVPEANNMTVQELFSPTTLARDAQKAYKEALLDAIVTEISDLTPLTIESYVWRIAPPLYHSTIIGLYREKMIQSFRNLVWLEPYSIEDRELIINAMRNIFNLQLIDQRITEMQVLVEKQNGITASDLVRRIFPSPE